MFVNICIGGSAIWVLIQNQDLLNASRVSAYYTYKSVKQTEQVLKLQERSAFGDSLADHNRKINDSLDRANQIRSIEEGRTQFRLETEPFIQISKVSIDTLKHNKPITISYFYLNHGKQPTQIISEDFSIGFIKHTDPSRVKYNIHTPVIDYYIGGLSILQTSMSSRDRILQSSIDSIKSEKAFLYMYGRLKYKNRVTKKVSTLLYGFKINPNPAKGNETLMNRTIE